MEFDKRPVLGGVLALVAVAVVVGLVAGLAALAGSRLVGLDGSSDAAGGSGARPAAKETLFLPKPTQTKAPDDPLVTLEPGEEESEAESEESDDDKRRKKDKSDLLPISLSAGQTEVSPMERIDLTGTYQGGEGAVLQVQKFEGNAWEDFPVTASVSGQTFSTYVQTSQTGKVKFRVLDTDSDKLSNPVTVTIG